MENMRESAKICDEWGVQDGSKAVQLECPRDHYKNASLRLIERERILLVESHACLVAAAVFKTVEASNGAWWVRFLPSPPKPIPACGGGLWRFNEE